ncbi:MAG: cation-translocating P-type ATPase, partial [Bacteroidota bacterium]
TYEWRKKIQIFGKNIIPEKKQNNLYKIILFQLLNSTTILLLVSIIISYSIGEWINGHAVLAVLIINMLIGVFMEYKADRSIRALKKLLQPKARVIRDGINQEINSIDIVPGDIIQVEAGDIIPADARIINSNELHVNESGLTGESMPVRKNNTLDSDHKTNYFKNIFLYKSTAVVNGKATAIVISTGIQTEIGKVAKSIGSIITESSPLDKKIRVFTKKIIRITLLLIFIIAVFGVLRKKEIYELFETAVSLAVASIPEGLPVAATLTLSYGMLRLAKHNVIVNKLSAVETLGNTTVICTDKTGTLTENKIAVAKIISSSENINSSEKFKNSIEIDIIMKISVLCNNSNLNISNKKNIEIGDPLDLAILKFSNDINFNYSEIKTSFPRISEIPFSSENKLMITEHKAGSSFLICIKGAFENVIRYCNKIQHKGATNEFSKSDYDLWTTNEKKLAQEGLRVLAVAYKNSDHSEINSRTGFIFLGLMGFADPPVKEIEREIRICKEAGIRVVMISGDHPETTKYIGKKIGILDEDDFVICGSELENSSKDKIDKCNAFARVTPIEKFNIVNRFREAGNIVAMTGDGINDAPALKRADVGIAMGLRGTDIAKESAGIILKDDSFKSIVYSN